MPSVRLPLSGDVSQTLDPLTWTSSGGQIGFFNIDLGSSADPQAERQIIAEVGSYGRQIGRIGDVLAILLKHADRSKFSEAERIAIEDLHVQLRGVDGVKRKRTKSSG